MRHGHVILRYFCLVICRATQHWFLSGLYRFIGIPLLSAWLTARDINPLPTTEINKFLAAPKGVKRSIDLLSGYKVRSSVTG